MNDPFADLIAWFDAREVDLLLDAPDKEHHAALNAVPGLKDRVMKDHPYLRTEEVPLWMEFVLHGLAEHSRIGRKMCIRDRYWRTPSSPSRKVMALLVAPVFL